MAIYGRFGDKVTIVRMGTLDDVRHMDKRRPDKIDREAIANGSYVVTKAEEGEGEMCLHHLAYLRADDGLPEIMREVRKVKGEGE